MDEDQSDCKIWHPGYLDKLSCIISSLRRPPDTSWWGHFFWRKIKQKTPHDVMFPLEIHRSSAVPQQDVFDVGAGSCATTMDWDVLHIRPSFHTTLDILIPCTACWAYFVCCCRAPATLQLRSCHLISFALEAYTDIMGLHQTMPPNEAAWGQDPYGERSKGNVPSLTIYLQPYAAAYKVAFAWMKSFAVSVGATALSTLSKSTVCYDVMQRSLSWQYHWCIHRHHCWCQSHPTS